jgi:hypothetical protein
MEQDIDIGKLTDRELLVKIATTSTLNFAEVRKDIKELKDGTTAKISDHEDRIRKVENDFLGKKEHENIHAVLEKFVEGLNTKINYVYAFSAGVAGLASLLMWIFENKK